MKKLCEKILNELKYKGFLRKQKSTPRLFPTFKDRVKSVASKGGVKLQDMAAEAFHFRVSSGTKDGVQYDVFLNFKNLPEMIEKHVANKKLWTTDMEHVDYRRLAAEIFNDVDIETDCSCPADTYWGPEYIKTRRAAQYGEQENRPPRVRNPRQYGIMCKHTDLVFGTLPFYIVTLGSYLKKFYQKEVEEAENKFRREVAHIQQAAGFLSKQENS